MPRKKIVPPRIGGTVRKVEIRTHPSIAFYAVDLESTSGSWPEVFGSTHDTELFLRGVKAGAALAGARFIEPDIPAQSTNFAEIKFK